MRRKLWKLVALVAAVAVLFAGCGQYYASILDKMGYRDVIHSDDMQYTRPDFEALQQQLETCCELSKNAESVQVLMEQVFVYFSQHMDCVTNYLLAQLRYSHDLSDLYWEEEYNWCNERISQLDAAHDRLCRTLAKSAFRQELESDEYFGAGFFDAYQDESIWTEAFTALMEQEAQLVNEYYELCDQAGALEYASGEYYDAYWEPMTQVLLELVAVRQQQAREAGYASYPEFAYEFYYMRAMKPAQAMEYMERIGDLLVPLYRQVNESDVWDVMYTPCYENQTFRYGKELAKALGGEVQEAFELLEQGQLYDISYSENKHNISYETWLPSYGQPFLFMCPTGTGIDPLTFVHEFGHFAADYVCGETAAGIDVAEVHSQGLEYLSLCCMENDPALVRYKLADSLCVYVEQSAYALFEHQLYALEGEALTAQNVLELYGQIGADFGFESWAWDSRDFVTITHFYTNPMYLISYVVSNDVALQLYERQQAQPGDGVKLYIQALHSAESDLSRFVQTYGLEDPLAEGRLETVLQTLTDILA